MRMKLNAAIIVLTAGLYVGTVLIGLQIRNFSLLHESTETKNRMTWEPPRLSSIHARWGDSIRYGALLFDETPLYASKYTDAKISCTSCHAEGGIQPYASPMVGVPALFPMYNQRAGHAISLRDRIQECFVRSEKGRPLPHRGPEMQALVDYISWLSESQPGRKPFVERGLINLPDLKPSPEHGAEVYAAQCAGCHGQNGEGHAPLFPPLWGQQSFNDGAGMNNVHKMAAFVQHNMPQNRMGSLSPQDAFDVAAFVHLQSRPAFNQAYKNF
jgi:thiosulfate dehydrogenase